MIYNVSLGVYVSSFAKDVVCTPRPYSPPVIRISESNRPGGDVRPPLTPIPPAQACRITITNMASPSTRKWTYSKTDPQHRLPIIPFDEFCQHCLVPSGLGVANEERFWNNARDGAMDR